jgi:hypothetical protein
MASSLQHKTNLYCKHNHNVKEWENRGEDIKKEEELTDVALFITWPYIIISFFIISFFSPGIGLLTMIGFFALHAVYFSIVTPPNKDQVWF